MLCTEDKGDKCNHTCQFFHCEIKGLFTWRWGTPGRLSNPLRRSNPPGACFSKVPIINGPGKLSPFSLKIEVSIVLHVT